MNYMGDFAVGQIVYIYFNTFDSNDPSASVTMTTFINTDVHIHKDDSLTQRNNAAGVTVDVDVDAIAGTHFIKIDTADNTVGDFFEAGHDYFVRIEGATVDAGNINAVVGCFSIANRRTAGQMAVTSIEGLTDQNTFTLTSGEVSANDDAYNDCLIIVTDQVTKIQKAIGYISDYTGSTRSVQLYASPLCTGFTMAIGDSCEIFSSSAFTNVHTVGRTAQTAGDIIADTELVIVDTEAVLVDTEAAITERSTLLTDTEAVLTDTEAATGVLADTEAIIVDTEAAITERATLLTDTEAVLVDTEAATGVLADTEAIIVDTEAAITSRATLLTDTEAVLTDTEAAITSRATLLTDTETILVDTEASTGIKKNTALPEFMFSMVDSTDGRTPKTGLTFATGDSKVKLDGAAFANIANNPVEVSDGMYVVDLDAADLNGDVCTFKFTGTGADARIITVITNT